VRSSQSLRFGDFLVQFGQELIKAAPAAPLARRQRRTLP
jgi:hypothetical protein